MSHVRALILLGAAAFLSLLPGLFTVPPVDRDEPRFAQATKQMVETGDYVNIRFQDAPRLKKPIGIYWLQAAAVKSGSALGVPDALTTIWLYRLPSLFGAVAAIWLTYWTALALVTRRAAVLAGLLMAGSALLGVEARLATTDAVLLLTTVAAMGALARVYLVQHGRAASDPGTWISAGILWTALAAGVLVKGPVLLLVFGLCAVTLSVRDRSLRWLIGLRPLTGLMWFAALTLPWFFAVEAQSSGSFIAASAEDILPRMLRSVEGHGAPPGYYLVLFWVTFWPGAALAGLAVSGVMASRRTAATAFLLAWLVPAWLVFELAVTKLPHYVLPLYPAMAILIAGAVETDRLSRRPWLRWGSLWLVVVPLVAGGLCVAAPGLVGTGLGTTGLDRPATLLVWALVVAAVVVSVLGWRRLNSGDGAHTVLHSTAAAILLSGAVFGVVLPRLPVLFPSQALAATIRASGCARPQAVTSLTYGEPSLVFLAGTDTRATDVSGAVAFLLGGSCRFAFVDTEDAEQFIQEAGVAGLQYSEAPRIEGFNFTKAANVSLAVYWTSDEE